MSTYHKTLFLGTHFSTNAHGNGAIAQTLLRELEQQCQTGGHYHLSLPCATQALWVNRHAKWTNARSWLRGNSPKHGQCVFSYGTDTLQARWNKKLVTAIYATCRQINVKLHKISCWPGDMMRWAIRQPTPPKNIIIIEQFQLNVLILNARGIVEFISLPILNSQDDKIIVDLVIAVQLVSEVTQHDQPAICIIADSEALCTHHSLQVLKQPNIRFVTRQQIYKERHANHSE